MLSSYSNGHSFLNPSIAHGKPVHLREESANSIVLSNHSAKVIFILLLNTFSDK